MTNCEIIVATLVVAAIFAVKCWILFRFIK
jgi:hypothetical protein